MQLVKLPSGRIVNIDHFVSMPSEINTDNTVRLMDGTMNLGYDDAKALYNWIERDSEWLLTKSDNGR